MNIVENVIYVTVSFPEKWTISNVIEENYNIKVTISRETLENNKITYYFYSNFDDNLDKLFDAIDYTIKFNLQAEEKIKLLLSKIDELKEIFNNEDINTLKTLQFKYKKKKIKTTKEIDNSPVTDENTSIVDDNENLENNEKNDSWSQEPDPIIKNNDDLNDK